MKKPRTGGSGASWFLLGERGDGREPITVTRTYAFEAPRTTPASITIWSQFEDANRPNEPGFSLQTTRWENISDMKGLTDIRDKSCAVALSKFG
jgi:hypothetical protein